MERPVVIAMAARCMPIQSSSALRRAVVGMRKATIVRPPIASETADRSRSSVSPGRPCRPDDGTATQSISYVPLANDTGVRLDTVVLIRLID